MIQLRIVAASIVQVLPLYVRVRSVDILLALSMAAWASASVTLGWTVTNLPPTWTWLGISSLASWSISPVAMVVSSMPRPGVPGTTVKFVPLTETLASLGGSWVEPVMSWSLVSRARGSSLTITGIWTPPAKVRIADVTLVIGLSPCPTDRAASAMAAASGPRPASW